MTLQEGAGPVHAPGLDETPLDPALLGLDHEAARCFLAAARCGCFMQAARSLSIKPTLLRKKLAQLAAWSGQPLFVHQGNTVVLSPEGRRLRQLFNARLGLLDLPRAQHEEQPRVRIAVAETLLHDILGRDLLAYLRQHARVRLDLLRLDSTSAPAAEVDVQVWLAPEGPPPDPGFPCDTLACLAPLDYLPHVAKRYSRESSRPRSLLELEDYMLVDLSGQSGLEALAPWNRAIAARRSGVTRVNAYEVQRQMIQWSACIGLLPHYVPLIDKNLLALPALFPQPMTLNAWLAVRSEASERDEVQRIVTLVRAAFEERRDWF